MMHGNQQVEYSRLPRWLNDLKRKKVTIEGDQGEPAKDSLTIKLVFSLEHRSGECMNSKNVPWLDEAWSFYREFGVGLLVGRH